MKNYYMAQGGLTSFTSQEEENSEKKPPRFVVTKLPYVETCTFLW